MGKKRKFTFWSGVTLAIVLIFTLFIVYPLLSLFASAFRDAETQSFTLANFEKFFSKKYYMRALGNSFKVTTVTTLLAVFIGAPLAYMTTAFKIKGKGLLDILIIISMLSPPFIGAYSWVLLAGRSGVITTFFRNTFGIELGSIYGYTGILLVLTLKLYPYIYMYTKGTLKKVDASLIEASESLGSHGLKEIFTVIMPLITPTILAGALIVFMNALADFGTPMLIGEGFVVMPVLIYNEFISELGGSATFAAAIAVILVMVTSVMFILQKYIVNKKSFTMSSLRPIQPKELKGIKNVLAHVAIYAIVIIVFLSMFISYITTRRKSFLTGAIDTLTMFPYIIPGSVLGITLLISFNDKPLILSGTATIIIVAFVVRRMPYTLRSSAAILYQISPSMEEAAISLGDSQVKSFFKVTAVMMLPGVLSGAILSWITIINELSASVILYTGSTRTMSVAIYTEVIRASYGTAAALASILTVTTVVSLLIFFKVSGKKEISL
ncbi:MAG: iron ABC transporter permease [Clostridium sp.]|nr:iron ABC transporter permease [Clostridium sp.]